MELTDAAGNVRPAEGLRAWVEVYANNSRVTDWYIRAIGDSLSGLGFRVEYVEDCLAVGNRKGDVYFVSEAKTAFDLIVHGCRNLVYWAQGIAPEEDYLRFKSRLRRSALALCEKTALTRATRVFAVSASMLHHFEKKYRIGLSAKTYVAPCCNETMHSSSFFVEGKYERPSFAYAGGLSKYQCIDRMLDLYDGIQRAIPDSELFFYTWDTEKAKELVAEHCLDRIKVSYVPQEKLHEALSQAKYGFVIRDNSIVNRVATPTKLSTYISNGVIPIVSDCVGDFAKESKRIEHVICCEEEYMLGRIKEMEMKNIIPSEIHREYEAFFEGYFSRIASQDAVRDFLLPLVSEGVQ